MERFQHDVSGSLGQLFEATVEQFSSRPAVIHDGVTLTYGGLRERVDEVASELSRSFGVTPGERVGVYLDRSDQLIVAILAIIRLGASYVPLDPDYPLERLSYMFRDSNSSVLITQRKHSAKATQFSTAVLDLDSPFTPSHNGFVYSTASTATQSSLAYVMYTSGSTGHPKGVAVTHGNIINLVLSGGYTSITPASRIAQLSNSSFDATTFELWGALLNGACLIIINGAAAYDPCTLPGQLSMHGITHAVLTSAVVSHAAAHDPAAFKHLDTLLFGGEKIDQKFIDMILRSEPPKRLMYMYGPTECTTFSTGYEVRTVDLTANSIPIGEAIGGAAAYILDEFLDPVGLGVTGELYVGGSGVAHGYLNKSSLTARHFLPDPFSAVAQARMYKTGDLARYLVDGQIEFMGRNDDQVKLRGYRLESAEIEAKLSQIAGVKDVVVGVKLVDQENQYLVAFIVTDNGASLDDGLLRRTLLKDLPVHMVPTVFVYLKEFPLTVNTKVDRARLLQQVITRDTVAGEPGPQVDQQLLAIWRKLLLVEEIGPEDDFFSLGGHSLLVIKLAGHIKREFEIAVPIDVLFEHTRLVDMASYLQRQYDQQARSAHGELAEAASAGYVQPSIFAPIMLKQGRASQLLALVHPAGGDVTCYRHLVERLPAEWTVLGFQRPELAGDGLPSLMSVEQLAQRYVTELLKVQASGPYRLGGWSMGGVIAFHMATLLEAQGFAVEFLGLIDSHFVVSQDQWLLSEHRQLDLASTDLTQHTGYQTVLASFEEHMQAHATVLSQHAIDMDFLRRLYIANWIALCRYQPSRPVSGLFFYAAQDSRSTFSFSERMSRLQALCNNPLRVSIVPGDHYSVMVAEDLPPLADRFINDLQRSCVGNRA